MKKCLIFLGCMAMIAAQISACGTPTAATPIPAPSSGTLGEALTSLKQVAPPEMPIHTLQVKQVPDDDIHLADAWGFYYVWVIKDPRVQKTTDAIDAALKAQGFTVQALSSSTSKIFREYIKDTVKCTFEWKDFIERNSSALNIGCREIKQ